MGRYGEDQEGICGITTFCLISRTFFNVNFILQEVINKEKEAKILELVELVRAATEDVNKV